MPPSILVKSGTASVWADSSDYSSSVSGLARTAHLDLTSVAAGAARQGAKADLGATRADRFVVYVAIEFASAPTSLEVVDIYWAGSVSGTAGNANPGGASGADAAYTGTSGDSLDDSAAQLIRVGPFVVTADGTTTVQYQQVGVLSGVPRYGMPIVYNRATPALVSDATEMFVALVPEVMESQ